MTTVRRDEPERQRTPDPRGQRPEVPLTFVLPGFSKCGTTTLAELLGLHPAVLLPTKLEPWFFSAPNYLDLWPWYTSLFPQAERFAAVGDDSTNYTSSLVIEDVVGRLAGYYPDVKLLFLARDPAARIESSFREFHHSGPWFAVDAPFTLHEAMDEFPQLIRDTCYADLIDTYRRAFPDEQIKVVFFEDLVTSPQNTLDACFEFLGVQAGAVAVPTAPQRNRGEHKLHDSRLLRSVRRSRLLGYKLAKIPASTQDRYFSKIGLRRRFTKPVAWTPEALHRLREDVYPDAQRFLARYGTPASGWRRLEALVAQTEV